MSAAIGIVILLVTNFFTNPAFFMGVFVFIGLLLIKKPWYEALAGFIKTAVGFFILQIGSNGLSNTFRPIVSAIGAKFGLEAAVIDTYFLTSQMVGPDGIYAMEGAIAWTMLAFVVSFAWNFPPVSLLVASTVMLEPTAAQVPARMPNSRLNCRLRVSGTSRKTNHSHMLV